MPVLARCLFPLLLLVPVWAAAGNLAVTLEGVEGEAKKNVLAWLGPEPETAQGRSAFVAHARERIGRSLQALGYYRPAIAISVERSDPVWQMAVRIAPGEPVRIRTVQLELLGDADDDPEFARLLAEPGITRGDPLHHGRYEQLKNRMFAIAQQRGYFDARVTEGRVAVHADERSADIALIFDSGPRYRFGAILYDGELAQPGLLRQVATFQPGDDYLQSQLQDLQLRLQRTGFYSSVLVQPRREQAIGQEIPIALELAPASRHSFDVGIGYSTDIEERLSVTWRTPKINRFGHSQVTRLQYSPVNPSGRFTYSIPLEQPQRDMLQLWARTEDNEFGDLDSRQDELGTRRELRRGKWIYGYSLRGLEESWDVLQESQTNDYLLLGASLSSREHSGPLVDPAAGFNQLYTLEGGSRELGSDIDLARITANIGYIATPLPDHRLVARTELGMAEISGGNRADLAPSLNFFAGGSRSIRGFAYQSIGNEIQASRKDGRRKTLVVGGDRLFTASLEYQYYFTQRWRGAVFTDGGDAFDDGEFNWNYGAGFGVHYVSPVGAIRVELANSLSEDEPDWYLHLNVGAEF